MSFAVATILCLAANLFSCAHGGSSSPSVQLGGMRPVEAVAFSSSAIASYGELSALDKCNHALVTRLEKSCNDLSPEEMNQYGLMLMNCQFQSEGKKTYACDTMKDCAVQMDNEGTYAQYLLFANRARATCHQTQQNMLRYQMEQTVNDVTTRNERNLEVVMGLQDSLADANRSIHGKLDTSLAASDALLHAQNQALANQEAIRAQGLAMGGALEEASRSLDQVQAKVDVQRREYQSTMREVFAVFEHISHFQHAITIGFSDLQSAVFYALALLVAILATASRRTARARFWILMALSANYALEHIVNRLPLDPEVIWDFRSTCRKGFMTLSFAILVFVVTRFRDYAQAAFDNTQQVRNTTEQIRNWSLDDFTKRYEATQAAEEYEGPEYLPPNNDANESEQEIEPLEMLEQTASDFSALLELEEEEEEEAAAGEQEKVEEEEEEENGNGGITALSTPMTPAGRRLGGYNLRLRKRAVFNPVLNIETPEEFAQAHKIWSSYQIIAGEEN